MKNIRKLAFVILFIISSVSVGLGHPSDEMPAVHQQPGQIQSTFGVYVTDLFNIDLSNSAYSVVFWAWWDYPSKKIIPQSSVDLEYAIEKRTDFKSEDMVGTSSVSQNKFTAKISNRFSTVDFPFDKQTLVLKLKDANLPLSELKFIPDTTNSGIGKQHLDDWIVTDFRIKSETKTIHSNLGLPTNNHSMLFSNITAYIDLKRSSFSLLFTHFIGFFIAIILCFVTFFDITNRVHYVLGSIFSAIGNKLSLDSMLPLQTQISFRDKIQLLTFFIIIFTVILATIARQALESGHIKRLNQTRVIAIWGIIFCSFILIPLFILQAMKVI